MRFLLDTHVLLWWRQNDSRLPHHWDTVFTNLAGEHEILFSLVSIWEISIKRRLGKLRMEASTEDFSRSLVEGHGFRQISLSLNEICRMEVLPDHHRDPFDRLLIAQALVNEAIAVTDDAQWKNYPVKVEF